MITWSASGRFLSLPIICIQTFFNWCLDSFTIAHRPFSVSIKFRITTSGQNSVAQVTAIATDHFCFCHRFIRNSDNFWTRPQNLWVFFSISAISAILTFDLFPHYTHLPTWENCCQSCSARKRCTFSCWGWTQPAKQVRDMCVEHLIGLISVVAFLRRFSSTQINSFKSFLLPFFSLPLIC